MSAPRTPDRGPIGHDPWGFLKDFTHARIALGRAGGSLPTRALLDFRLAHAQARDAVHLDFEAENSCAQFEARGWQTVRVASAAPDRRTYLQRPDLGRQLDEASGQRLAALPGATTRYDVVFVIGDGLSALAVHHHAMPLLEHVLPVLKADGWRAAPLVVATQARVALGDEVGSILGASMVVMLIGERPGLSSPDSLGVYLTFDPRSGRMDSERNCLSNIRPEGMAYPLAAHKLLYLMRQTRLRRVSGVLLKDEAPPPGLGGPGAGKSLVPGCSINTHY
jgi:ethanolamine ammonia-lyase small subunit